MPSSLNEQQVDQITQSNAKMLADQAQSAIGLTIQNAVASQQSVQAMVNATLQNGLTLAQSNLQAGLDLSRAVLARSVRFTFDTSAEEAVGFAKQMSADLASKMSDLEAALSGGQQMEKIAITTPPQTGTGGAFGSDAGAAILQQLSNINAVLASIAASQKP